MVNKEAYTKQGINTGLSSLGKTFMSGVRVLVKDNSLRKISKNVGIIFFGNTTASALNLVSFTIIANQLGPSLLAVLVIAQTYALIVNDIFNIQTWESMIKFGAVNLRQNKLADTIKTNLLLDIVSAVCAFIFALLLVKPVSSILGWDSTNINIIALYSLSILANLTSLTIGIPRLFDKFKAIARIQVIVAVIKLGCVIIALTFTRSLHSYIYIFLFSDMLANVLLAIYSLLLVKSELCSKWWKGSIKFNKEHLRFIWWTNLRTIIRIPIRHFDMIIISSVISMNTVGVYKVYKEIAGIISRIGEPINQAVFPEFTKLIGNGDITKTGSITKKVILILTCLSVAITVSLLLSSKFLIGAFYGIEYLSEINVLYFMQILLGISFALIPINSLFIAAGFAKYSFLLVLFTNTVYLIVAFSFGVLIGIYGVVIAFAVQMVLNQGLKMFFLNKFSSDWGVAVR
jgi:O-antigen/teichoic acid export membrane protein